MNETLKYTGWYRRGKGRWQRLCEGTSEAACWQLLAAQAPADRARDLAVLPAGRDPNYRPRPAPTSALPFRDRRP